MIAGETESKMINYLLLLLIIIITNRGEILSRVIDNSVQNIKIQVANWIIVETLLFK